MRRWISAIVCCLWATLSLAQENGDSSQQQQMLKVYRQDLAHRLEDPMAAGLDVTTALSNFFAAGDMATKLDFQARSQLYWQAFDSLKALEPLARADWQPVPETIPFEVLDKLELGREFYTYCGIEPVADVDVLVVRFTVDELTEYGIMVRPQRALQQPLPLIVYCHGAAFGVPTSFIPWLARLAATGYVIVGPAFRGEPLLTSTYGLELKENYHCDGQIENLLGEPRDVIAIANGALALPEVKDGKFAILGHSFGSGAGLLAAARSDQVACAISYDAWMVNPFRFYWERLRGGSPVYWESWEAYTRQPVPDQLSGLMARSIVHNADRVKAPLLLFMGGAYNPSAYHRSHTELVANLEKHGKTVRYEIIPGGGHNFVLYVGSGPALRAYRIQTEWLNKYFPPLPPAE